MRKSQASGQLRVPAGIKNKAKMKKTVNIPLIILFTFEESLLGMMYPVYYMRILLTTTVFSLFSSPFAEDASA